MHPTCSDGVGHLLGGRVSVTRPVVPLGAGCGGGRQLDGLGRRLRGVDLGRGGRVAESRLLDLDGLGLGVAVTSQLADLLGHPVLALTPEVGTRDLAHEPGRLVGELGADELRQLWRDPREAALVRVVVADEGLAVLAHVLNRLHNPSLTITMGDDVNLEEVRELPEVELQLCGLAPRVFDLLVLLALLSEPVGPGLRRHGVALLARLGVLDGGVKR